MKLGLAGVGLVAYIAHATDAARNICAGVNGSALVDLGKVVVGLCSDSVVRVFRGKEGRVGANNRESLVVVDGYGRDKVSFQVHQTETVTDIRTLHILLKYNKLSGLLTFHDSTGKVLTQEVSGKLEEGGIVERSWMLSPDEILYGFGQFVNGWVGFNGGTPLHLAQFNTEANVPFFVSTRGYGILWDNYANALLNPPDTLVDLKNNGTLGDATWVPTEDGTYWLFVQLCDFNDFGCAENANQWFELKAISTRDNSTKMYCDHHIANIPNTVTCKIVDVEKGVPLRIELKSNPATNQPFPKLFMTSGATHNTTTIQMFNGKYEDYYFVVDANGKGVDGLIEGYRQISGTAYNYERWVYGFWQSKEHYSSQEEILTAAKKFRDLRIPVDNIVQDWKYWGKLGWGPHWDPEIYPDPKQMVDKLHDLEFQFMVSVWSKFDKNTKFYKAFKENGELLPDTTWFDPWNPTARTRFFNYSQESMFEIGVDALWLDATEPEFNAGQGQGSYIGPVDEFTNTYSLMISRAIFEGRQETTPFSLTRSAFPGQQRYGATLWSGDITGSWDSLRRQIAMSINYQLSGMPYWSMDIGGFFRPQDQYTNPDYQQLYIRWFQFGAFVPIFRVHGANSKTELWNFQKNTQDTIVESAIRLRYLLIHYIYAGFQAVEDFHYTMQRGLIFDFAYDKNVHFIADQFMFGKSIMVAPIYTADNSRRFYLPENETWVDFYDGTLLQPGWHQVKNYNISRIILFIRMGSVIVMSPVYKNTKIRHEDNTLADPLEVRIYPGRDASFDLILNATVITLHWSDTDRVISLTQTPQHTLWTVTFNFLLVRAGVGVGVELSTPDNSDHTMTFTGSPTSQKITQATDSLSARSIPGPETLASLQ